jgi:tight adherence protein B
VSNQIAPLAGVLAGLAVLLAFGGYVLNLERRRLEARLQTFVGGGSISRPQKAAPFVRPKRRVPRTRLLQRLRLGVRPRQLSQAGVSVTPRRFAWLQLGAVLVGLTIAFLVATKLGLNGLTQLATMACLGIAGLGLPHLILRVQRARRLRQFELQLASALDSIANSMQVGLSVPQALEMISRDMPAPLGPEFGQVLREMGMGLGLGEALDHLAERVPLQDVEIFAAAVHIQHRTGGYLSGVLRTIAATVRERVNLRGEIRSLTAQQRVSAYLVGALPLFLAFVLKFLSPAYFDRLLDPGLMRVFVVLAGVGIALGFHFMMRIADIEV